MYIGVLGYGKLGKALCRCLEKTGAPLAVFSDRESIEGGREENGIRFYPTTSLLRESTQALFLAHGSFGAYREECIRLAERHSILSAYDIHQDLVAMKREIHPIAVKNKTVAILGIGWDPGVLSLARALCRAILPECTPKTEWGEGVSEGHSFVLRSILGVKDGIQYTVPTEGGHRRVCYVVSALADRARICEEILGAREYFNPETTEVHFVGEEEFERLHKGREHHRGKVSAVTDDGSDALSLEVRMCHNPVFTAKIMRAYLNALRRLKREEHYGAYGPLDIPLSYLCDEEAEGVW